MANLQEIGLSRVYDVSWGSDFAQRDQREEEKFV